jgi:prepilin-type N-terminal cleavage/methylation domain-containing protein
MRRGYTLVEVLVTVVIMGIAGSVVVPSMSGAGVLRIQAGVQTIVADINFAQMDALTYQQSRGIVFDTNANAYTIVEVHGGTIDPVADALYDPRGPGQRYVVDLDNYDFGGAALENIDFNGGAVLIFDEIGGPVAASGSNEISSGGTIELAGPQGRFRINVAAFSGRVTVDRLD